MDIELNQKELQAVVADAVERAVARYLRTKKRRKQVRTPEINAERMGAYVMAARSYVKDARFAPVLKLGLMPHGKLQRLMKMDLEQFRSTLDEAIRQGRFRVAAPGTDYPDGLYQGIVYAPLIS